MSKNYSVFLRYLFVGLSVCSGVNVYAEASPCSNIVTSQQVFDCSVYKEKKADVDLNQAYKNLKQRVSSLYKADPALGEKYFERVKEAQRAWLHLRDLTCSLEAFEIENGTQAYLSIVNNCLARMDYDRSAYLRHLADK